MEGLSLAGASITRGPSSGRGSTNLSRTTAVISGTTWMAWAYHLYGDTAGGPCVIRPGWIGGSGGAADG